MTEEIEQKFFEIFGIEKQEFKGCNWNSDCPFDIHCKDCPHWEVYNVDYPEITAEKLLELICVITKFRILEFGLEIHLGSYTVSKLRDEIIEESFYLLRLIQNEDRKENYKQEIHRLFEEG